MKNIIDDLTFNTSGKGMYEITNQIIEWVKINKVDQG